MAGLAYIWLAGAALRPLRFGFNGMFATWGVVIS
jgi:hypothetical protein